MRERNERAHPRRGSQAGRLGKRDSLLQPRARRPFSLFPSFTPTVADVVVPDVPVALVAVARVAAARVARGGVDADDGRDEGGPRGFTGRALAFQDEVGRQARLPLPGRGRVAKGFQVVGPFFRARVRERVAGGARVGRRLARAHGQAELARGEGGGRGALEPVNEEERGVGVWGRG